MPFANAILAKKSTLTPDTLEMTFQVESNSFHFSAGQYIWLILPKLISPDPKGERRAFSITSSSSRHDSVSILFRVSNSSYKKSLLNMKIGSEAQISGPFGSSLVCDFQNELIMIGSGVGIAPFMGIIRSIDSDIATPKLKLISITMPGRDNFITEEFRMVCSNHHTELVEETGPFHKSFVSSASGDAVYFISGTQRVVDDIYEKLVDHGIQRDKMKFEQFYPSKG